MPRGPLFQTLQGVAAVCIAGWIYWISMFYTAPRAADATHVVPENNHGTIVYFTRAEALFGPICWVTGAIAVISGNIWCRRTQDFRSKYFR